MTAKRPFVKFFYKDWLSDTALRRCSAATRGIWMDLICRMHDADAGEIAGTIVELARECNADVDEMATALAELKRSGTADVDRIADQVIVTSRRMAAETERRRRDRERKTAQRARAARNYWTRKAAEVTPGCGDPPRYNAPILREFCADSARILRESCANPALPVIDVTSNGLSLESGGEGASAKCHTPLLQKADSTRESALPVRKENEAGRNSDDDPDSWDDNRRGELAGRASELATILGGARTINPHDPADRRLVLGVAILVMLRRVNDEEIRVATMAAQTKPKNRRVAYFYGTLRRVVAERDDGPALDEMLNGLRIPPAPFPRRMPDDQRGTLYVNDDAQQPSARQSDSSYRGRYAGSPTAGRH